MQKSEDRRQRHRLLAAVKLTLAAAMMALGANTARAQIGAASRWRGFRE